MSARTSGKVRSGLASALAVLALAGSGCGKTDDDDSAGGASAAGGVDATGGTDAVGGTGGTGGTGAGGPGQGATARNGTPQAGRGGASTAGAGGSAPRGGSGGNGTAASGGVSSDAPEPSPFIVVDQFGYLPNAEKVAVIRDPQTGADADESFTPGATYALAVAATGVTVFTAEPSVWNGGAEDASSGDKAFWFDFSSVTEPGQYYVVDVDKNVRSHAFAISDGVYADVLKQSLRMFFYQRLGQDKTAAHAGAGWVDGPSHVGPLQDHQARLFSDKDNAATEKDLWGGWYDAGDYNKYTSWTASYVENLLRAYAENPAAFGDDNAIPESGNGIADVLDEARFGLDFLTRMQNSDGSLLSIVGEASASPPSAATGPSLYGNPSTSATLATAAAFAYGASVLSALDGLEPYADDLRTRAENAYAWADANPQVVFRNNDSANGSSGLGAGQQEVDDAGRLAFKLDAAIQLYRLTGDEPYRAFVDDNYDSSHLIAYNNYVAPWDVALQDALLEYSDHPDATPAVASAIRAAYLTGVLGGGNLEPVLATQDPYLAYMKDYGWGSNSTKSLMGNLFMAAVVHELDADANEDLERAAARYVHYLHGVNPLGLVYLSNMGEYGAENSVNEIYHVWFVDKSPAWDRVGTSTYGPPPGYLAGGPNPSYDVDGCCPSGCGSTENNAVCTAESISPPKGQPPQKSYKDFNTNWPLNSWSVTEPSGGYQIAYIRLLSKLVR